MQHGLIPFTFLACISLWILHEAQEWADVLVANLVNELYTMMLWCDVRYAPHMHHDYDTCRHQTYISKVS